MRVVGDCALHGLPDPPGGVGRELEAAPPVELLDRAVEPQRPLLDQVEERHAEAAVPLGDRDDEPEVGLDHPALGDRIALLDLLRERDLLGGGQQLVAAYIGEKELQAVRRAGEHLGRVVGGLDARLLRARLLGGRLALLGRADLETEGLELARKLLDLVLAEVVLERERLELLRAR